ncbi:MAG: aminotransferase class IV, partial [Verrucomicrobiales bacterium]|nr:aminotransferase class IV [Verrucomicrobiales bacterium]
MVVFLNGKFVDERDAAVFVFDRSFLYGDGLFETVRVQNGKLFRFAQHIARLTRGAEFLRLRIPY